ncbi:MAG: 3-methyl-2-oxobutanoate hydroxymethyltransferase, partial [Phycisphaeraceae bacterium]
MRFLSEGMADVVKLEVDASFAPLVDRLSHAGVPVVAHLGSRPQRVRAEGGYRAAGRSVAEADALVEQVELMLARGAVMILLEAVPAEVSQRVVACAERAGPVPVIGCGAGAPCHGHVVVLHDLLGLSDWQPPFAPPVGNLGKQLQSVAAAWVEQIAKGRYPGPDHPYKIDR